eukprot:6064710-Pyramimonas_sp.AAC.1
MGSRCSLASFTRSSLSASARDSSAERAPRDPWPCPPAPALPPPPSSMVGRARERWRIRRASRALSQHAAVALNWLTLGHPSFAPPEAQVSETVTPCQEGIRERLERLCRIAVRLAR